MPRTFDQLSPRAALIDMARDFHARGWMAGTAGNLSVKVPADEKCRGESFWITASGLPKGNLLESDFIRINIDSGTSVECPDPNNKPSAETGIHRALYQLMPDCQVCLHVHSVEASLATSGIEDDARELALPPLEMMKGLDIWVEEPKASIALFENHLDVEKIAQDITSRFQVEAPQIPALLIRNHGVTVWGRGLQEAYNRVEIVEFLLSYLARRPTH
jgi:methylthioribulose-1-phosphate dehydratase